MQQERVKPTLKRTKFACVNCKAAKAACDSNRPCAWCIRHALQDSCVDAPRKVRTSKKICCDPSLHSKNVVFKQEYKAGNYALALASDFTPTTAIPPEAPLSPPSEIFPIEDLLNPSFDFGPPSNQQPCSNCPLFHTCAKDAPQRLICATSASPPHSPLSEGFVDDEPSPNNAAPPTLPPVSLSSHPDYCLQLPPIAKISTQDSATTPFSFSLQSTPSPAQYLTPQMSTPSPATISQTIPSPPQPPQEQVASPAVTQPRAASGGCCSFASSPHLPPLLDDVCNCQTLVQREMAKINASLETITALMQLQSEKVPLLPTATFNIPDTVLQDCNDEFAKALGYDGRDDLFATADVDALAISTQQMMKPSNDEEEDGATPKKQHKLSLTTLIPEKWAPGMLKCAVDLQKAVLPLVNQLVFSSKRGETRYFTVLIKPCGWFAYISLLKQHPNIVEGITICGQ